MKKTATIILLSLAFFLGSTFRATADANIGTVDMKTVFEKYWRTKEAEAKMSEIRAQIKRDLDERAEKRKTLEAEITKFNEELKKTELSAQKKDGIAKEREKRILEWQEMMKEFQSFSQEKEKQLQDQTMRIRNGIVDEIKKVVSDIVKSKGFDLVFDTSGNSINNVPVVMYAKKGYEFTDEVVEKLNADRPKTGAAEPAGTPTPSTPPAAESGNTPKPKNK